MKITEIFEALEHGELSTQTSLVDTVTGVKVENYPKVISHINFALTDLHTRFNLRLGDVWIMMQDAIGEYVIDKKHAFTNEDYPDEPKYLIDSVHAPFQDDFIKLVEATDEIGQPLPINDRTKEKSIFTPSQNSIQIPWKVSGDAINIIYRAAHKNINLSDYDSINDIEINVTRTFLEPILYYVAYRHFAGVGGQSGTPTSNGYYEKYLAKLKDIDFNGIANQDQSTSNNLIRDGYP